MKTLLSFILFFIFNLITYSDYLLTNSEIVTFYDETRNELRYIKGNSFREIDISKVSFLFIDNENKKYDLKNYIKNIEKIKDTNILKINYKVKNNEIEIKLIPSIIDKSNFIISFKILRGDYKNSKIILKLITQEDRKLANIKNYKNLRYDNFNISTSLNEKDYKINFENIENNKNYFLDESEIKLRKNNIFYLIVPEKEKSNFLLEDEEDFWRNQTIVSSLEDKFFGEVLQNLYLLSENILLPDKFAFSISEENSVMKAKLIYIRELLKFPVDINQVLKEIILRKTTLESIELYNILFSVIDESSYSLNEKLFNTIIRPQVLTIIDMIDENGKIVAEEDNIEIYYKLYNLIKLLNNRHGFQEDSEWLLKTGEKLKTYVNDFYFKDNKIKRRRYKEEYNLKDVQYIDIFGIENKKEYLKEFFINNFSEKYNLILTDRNYIDIDFNLIMIDLFNEYELYEEAEKILKGVNKTIEETGGYLLPKYNIYSKNNIGIYGESIYLYLKMYNNRRNILEKK